MSYAPPPRWTFIFIGIALLGFIFQQATDLWVFFAFFPAFVIDAPWTFLTSIFLHGGFSHLFFSMFALFFFGLYLERMVGRKAFAVLFLLSWMLGNLGYLVTAGNPFTPAIGASGAVYGVIGALATVAPFMIIFVYGMVPMPLIVAAFFWGLLDFAGLFVPSGIAHGAHLSGMFVGAAFGIYFRMRLRKLRLESIG